ncbi:MAG: SlyX family protein [Bacteriovoracia bacterium]
MEERLINLEVKFSHQDEFILQLNKIVTEQQERIERLEKESLELRRIIEAMDGGNDALSLENSKPPHY